MKKASLKTLALFVLAAALSMPQACLARTGESATPSLPAGLQRAQFTLATSSFPFFGCDPSIPDAVTDISGPTNAVPLSFSMADFTGDTHPDLATVSLDRFDALNAQYSIEIQLTEGGHQSLLLTGPPGGLFVTAMDVTGDGTPDLVVHVSGSPNPVAIFLNDGCGHFAVGEHGDGYDSLQEFSSAAALARAGEYSSAPAVASGPCTIDCQHSSRRFTVELRKLMLPLKNQASSPRYLHVCSDRAPPAIS